MPGYGLGYSSLVNRSIFSSGPSVDPNAQAFITAAGITDPNQQSAINQLVVDLKGYGIWTKMSALYPFVGGTATTHKYNLKNPLDTNAAFRLVFSGGGTHSVNGYQTNGVNAFAETYYNPSVNLTDINSNHISIYSRTNIQGGVDMGGGPVPLVDLALNYNGAGGSNCWNMASFVTHYNLDSRCFMINSRTASNTFKIFKNGSVLVSSTGAAGGTKPNTTYHIGKRNLDPLFTNRQYSFASIGDGLTDTEAANFYTAVQTFQTTLGRSIGTQTVSDADAQAFVTAASIIDQVQATAINNLVIGMKADGLWTKMKAVYPFVGGTASSHKYNLKNPLDTDAAFRLVFNGGITHDSNGIKGNASNGYYDTKLNPSTHFSLSTGGSAFVATNENIQTSIDFGAFQSSVNYRFQLGVRDSSNGLSAAILSNAYYSTTNTNSIGFYGITRPANDNSNFYTIINTNNYSTADSYYEPNSVVTGFAFNIDNGSIIQSYSNRRQSFACIGEGITTSQAQDLRTLVNTFNTTLGR